MWMIAGRILLSFFIRNKENIMNKFFVKFTDPLYNITRRLIPFAKESCIPPLSIFLVILVRLLLIIITRPEIKP